MDNGYRWLNRDQWLEKLELMNQSLKRQGATVELTLVGSAAGIFAGQPSRKSIDLKVWKPRSMYQVEALRKAAVDAGLQFDPTGTPEPDTPYIQLLDPGLVQTGEFDETETIEQFGALRLDRPPAANLIASKLLRCDSQDLGDIAFLKSFYQPAREDIEHALDTLPPQARQKASENLVYLDVLSEKDLRPIPLASRAQELAARYLLGHLDEIPTYLKGQRWEELAVLAEFAAGDAPNALAQTDLALYRLLRGQITEYRICGWSQLNARKLRELAQEGR